MIQKLNWTYREIGMTILGSAIYAFSVTLFLQPLKLYAGGFVGFAQLIRSLFFANLNGVDIAGMINLGLNIPLFLLAWRFMKKKMLFGTFLSVGLQTVIFTLIPIPALPILDDTLASILISGVAAGVGCGIVLTAGSSAGGLDLLGVYLSQKIKGFSVGKMNLGFNIVLYSVCAIVFNLQTAVYSILWIVVFSRTLDYFHYQNIEVEMMIFTHEPQVKEIIMRKYIRGVTCWDGEGAYTNRKTEVLISVVAKSEIEQVKRDVLALDPKAFMIECPIVQVTGGYEKRLI